MRRIALLVTELVTNSVLHAGLSPGDLVDFHVTNGTGGVRLAVHDSGAGFTFTSSESRDPLDAGGRGLPIVAAISDIWGIDCDGDGCTVWCEVPVEERPAAAAASAVAVG